MNHILIATDGSELASKAVTEGISLASALGAHITFLTVTAPLASLGDPNHAFKGMAESVRRDALAYLAADADRTLLSAQAAADSAGIKANILKVENNHPHEAIITTAKSTGADLIIVASHGHSGMKAMLLGSVAQKVLAHSKLPVLVCRHASV